MIQTSVYYRHQYKKGGIMNKYDGYRLDVRDIEEVHLPVHTIGVCLNSKNCKNYKTDLGDGYCVDCFDKGKNRLSP